MAAGGHAFGVEEWGVAKEREGVSDERGVEAEDDAVVAVEAVGEGLLAGEGFADGDEAVGPGGIVWRNFAGVELVGEGAVDDVFGQVFAEDKGAVLLKQNARVYVGDHIGDVLGAHVAGALAVAVATGPYSAAELEQAGAEVVLPDLTGFPSWLDAYLAG